MPIKTECHLRPAQCKCEKTGELLDRYSVTLSVGGLTIDQAGALLPQINAEAERLLQPLTSGNASGPGPSTLNP